MSDRFYPARTKCPIQSTPIGQMSYTFQINRTFKKNIIRNLYTLKLFIAELLDIARDGFVSAIWQYRYFVRAHLVSLATFAREGNARCPLLTYLKTKLQNLEIVSHVCWYLESGSILQYQNLQLNRQRKKSKQINCKLY